MFMTRILYMDTGNRCATRENRFYRRETPCVSNSKTHLYTVGSVGSYLFSTHSLDLTAKEPFQELR